MKLHYLKNPHRCKMMFFALALMISWGFLSHPVAAQSEIRALWVTRWDYESPDDVVKIMTNAASANFNVVLFQIRGNATTFYPSDLEPWAEEIGGQDPGWDPLATALREGHARGLQVHVWLNICPGWHGKQPPSQYGQLWNQHPDWFAHDSEGDPQQLNSGYVWLALTHPEVQQHLTSVVLELIRKYPVDGVHFDYIRFPGPGISYDSVSVAEFRKQTGGAPNDYPRAWDQFRRNSITAILSSVRDSLATLTQSPVLSAAVWRDHTLGRQFFLQDAHVWLSAGLLDWLFPMIYTEDLLLFENELANHLAADTRGIILPGINPRRGKETLREIDIARRLHTQGQAIFSYNLLFPEHQPGVTANALRTVYFTKKTSLPKAQPRRKSALLQEVYTLPATPSQREPFFIYGRYNPNRLVFSRAYVEWRNPLPEVALTSVPGDPATLISTGPIMLADDEQWLEFRLVVIPQETTADTVFSEWQHLPVAYEQESFGEVRSIGRPIAGAQYIEKDGYGNLWVSSWVDSNIQVMRPDGQPLPFSPLRFGLDDSGKTQVIHGAGGLACLRGDTILVAAGTGLLYRFRSVDGEPIPGIRLPFVPGEVAVSNLGEIFATESGQGDWYHFYPDEEVGKRIPVKGGHLLRGIAVAPDGLTAYAACQSDGTVHQWQRLNALSAFSQVPDMDVEALGIGCVDTDQRGNIYVSHTGSGFVTVFSPEGNLRYVVRSEKPLLRGPRGVAVAPTGLFVTQMGGETSMPVLFFPLLAKSE